MENNKNFWEDNNYESVVEYLKKCNKELNDVYKRDGLESMVKAAHSLLGVDEKMVKNKDRMWEDKEHTGSLKDASKALDKIFNRPVERDMETLTELEKAITEDYVWAKQTQIILENFNDEDEKSQSLAFLNGVLFATGRYNDILDEMKED